MSKIQTRMKRHRVLSVVILAVFLCYLWYDMPFKATDPNSPYFVEELFRLRDYGSAKGVQELQTKVLPKLFPVSTPKDYVDLMLVERGGAQIIDKTDIFQGNYTYYFKPLYLLLTPEAFFIDVYFDKSGSVEAIWFFGKTIVNPDYKTKSVRKK